MPDQSVATDFDLPPGLLPLAPEHWEAARLPLQYEKARRALVRCERIDICLQWRNRAAAYASYYRQAKDKTLLELAQRIRLRAIRRLGELMPGDASPEIAQQMTTSEQRTARNLARIPEHEFEAAIQRSPVPAATVLGSTAVEPRLNRVRNHHLDYAKTWDKPHHFADQFFGYLGSLDDERRRAHTCGVDDAALIAAMRGGDRVLAARIRDFLAVYLATP